MPTTNCELPAFPKHWLGMSDAEEQRLHEYAKRAVADALTATTQRAPAAAEQSEKVREFMRLADASSTLSRSIGEAQICDEPGEVFALETKLTTARAALETALREALAAHPPAAPVPADLMQAVEQILDAGHMNHEDLARLRIAWEASAPVQAPPSLAVTPGMIDAAYPWLLHLHHMNSATKRANIEEALRAALAAAPSLAVGEAPEGWQLVPVEPTGPMTFAGQQMRYHSVNSMGAIYRAMLAAAPKETK